MSTNQSHIGVSDGQCTSFVGRVAIDCFRAFTLASGLRLYAKTKMIPTCGVTITMMLKMAERYTGKKYKRGDAMKAADDVTTWARNMRNALPKIDNQSGEILP